MRRLDRWRRSRPLPEGTIYPALHRLEQPEPTHKPLVTAESGRRRIYSLTKRGKRGLAEQRAVWEQFSDAGEWPPQRLC